MPKGNLLPIDLDYCRQQAENFEKLTELFPNIHPAALHAILVKHNNDWVCVGKKLLSVYERKTSEYWEEKKKKLDDIIKESGQDSKMRKRKP